MQTPLPSPTGTAGAVGSVVSEAGPAFGTGGSSGGASGGASGEASGGDAAAPTGSSGSAGSSGGLADAGNSGEEVGTHPMFQGLVKILILGSSNETNTCWRAFLWQKLRDAGVMNFHFVGRYNTGPDCGVAGYDKNCEAQAGTIFTSLSANDLATRFKANPPDIVLVHIAGADARNGVPIPKILDEHTLTVEQARMVNPKVMFFVAQHTPQVPPTGIKELNAALPGWAMQISTPESPVAIVDLFTGIVPATDQSDGTHLNIAGSQKAAGWWLNVLLPLFKP
jgi:hypothetical protein